MTTPVKPKGFAPGHPRYGGRQRGPARRMKDAYAVIEELSAKLGFDCDPLAQLVLLGCDPKQSVEIRLKALADALPFCRPKLQATAHQIEARVDAEVSTLSITQILSDPKLADAAQTLAFSLVELEQHEDEASPPTILYDRYAAQRGPRESQPLALPASEEDQQ